MLRSLIRRRQTLQLAILETMESRQLLSLITGTPGDDHIVIAYGDVVGDVIIVTAPGYEDGTVLHHTRMFDIDGGDGNDYIEIQKGGYVKTKIPRGSGNWVNLYGGNGDDTLVGGDNGTTFDGGAGDDQLVGRQDSGWEWMDDLSYSGALHGVIVRLDLGEVQDDGFGGHDIISGFGGVTGTPFDDVIYGGSHNEWIYGQGGNDLLSVGPNYAHLVGGDGDDTLLGGDGHDEFDPGAGNDSVVGGGGFDHLSFYGDDSSHGRIIHLDLGLVEDDGSGGVDHISGIEAVTISGSTNDVIFGDDKNNQLWGGDGADFIFGGAGNDSLTGGNGSTLLGGSGNDYIGDDFHFHVINGGRGADTIEMWGYSDSVDHIMTDSDDTIIDRRESRPTPDGEDRPARIDKPYVDPDGDDTPAEAAQKLGEKQKRHARHKKLKHHDLPIAARLLTR